MKDRFSPILPSDMKKRGFALLILLILLFSASTFLVSCTDQTLEAVPDTIIEQPPYHLAPYRSEPGILFYETSDHIGLHILNGIFLFNYKEDRMEASFALSEGSFDPGYEISPAMTPDEKSIIIIGINHPNGTLSNHFYRYDIATAKLSRVEGKATEIATLPYPPEDRQLKALQSETWQLEDLRYYPQSGGTYIPFKRSDIPAVTYELQDKVPNIPIPPKLTLMDDGRFVFVYSSLSSYLNYGKYQVTGTEYKLLTDDGMYTFVFHKEGDNLVFDAELSASCALDNGRRLHDGAVFAVK